MNIVKKKKEKFINGLGWRAKDKFLVKKKDQENTSFAIMSTNTTSY